MGRTTLALRDFRGEYGTLGRKAPWGSWTGKNVVRLVDGSICPRAGLVDLAPTGVPVGAMRAMGWTQAGTAGSKLLWFVVGTSVYAFDGLTVGDATTVAYTGALATTGAYPYPSVDVVSSTSERLTYLSVPGDKTYRLNHNTDTVTGYAGSAGGRALRIYKERLVGIDATTGNRLRFSAAGDFTSWPTANYIDVGDGWPITGIFPMRDGLLVAKQNGDWWWITGTIGTTSTWLRKVLHAVSPSDGVHEPPHAAVIGDELVWFVPSYRDYPASYDSVTPRHERHLVLGNGSSEPLDSLPASFGATPGRNPDEVLFVSGMESNTDNRAMLRRHGVWSFHTFDVDLSSWVAMGPLGICAISDGGAAGVAAKFWAWNLDIERPAIAADTLAKPGDASSTAHSAEVTFAEWWSEDGREHRVRKVVLDITKWDTGGASTNHVDVTVRALGRGDPENATSGGIDSSVMAWDEAGSSASTSGTRQRLELLVADQGYGAGFSLKLSAIRGIQVHAVYLEIEGRREDDLAVAA